MWLKYVIFIAGLSVSLPVMAQCSFRLADGKLLRCGMASIEVIERVGQPLLREQRTLGVSTNAIERGQTVEVWSYKVKADVGGEFLLSIELTDGKVTTLDRKQQGRL
ncbi:DUF2845 domain-containing protein [Alishewanella tabrizica]|uniref:DUF2845 domain-containing protein n=1 Tax=Alishewanella tabrizica TaxID=671278 RepID=A0ABQ2WT47_9ALTE|nr:DUF2845 domain-containing protein [Alishewanella tabrizica]GGW66331.1 hypothetical protein GCM10008111_22870 [Alishewanella tabrizica]